MNGYVIWTAQYSHCISIFKIIDPIIKIYIILVKGAGHLGHDEAMEAGGREFDPRPGHYSRMSF